MFPPIDGTITQSIEQTIQSEVRKPVDIDRGATTPGVYLVGWMARAGNIIPSWWSKKRDGELRRFWKSGDHLAGAIYTMESKMTAIPRKVIARDNSIREHVQQAEFLTKVINEAAQWGEGWESFFAPWLEDLLTQDNGAFAEVIGEGPKDGPIFGQPISLAHLDSYRCQRTGNAEFPVIYSDTDNRKYKLHFSRVMLASQMPSPIAEMHRVGFCAVSRALNVAQTLIDILQYKQEKLGSRPHRAIVITKGGLDPSDFVSAFQIAEGQMDSQGLSRYSKLVVAGSGTLPDAGVDVIELSKLPDGFDEQTSTTLGIATIALALGVDARELFPSLASGATRADALLQHLKQRGKGPGQIISIVEQLMNHKFLPPHLQFVFDFQDDAQDRQEADIRHVRSQQRERDINSGSVSVRVAREQMLTAGDIDRSQFERMELMDGRLPNGISVLSLFYSTDKKYTQFLNLESDDPLNTDENDPEAMLELIHERLIEVQRTIVNETNPERRQIATQALLALVHLEKHYLMPQPLSSVLLGIDNATETGQAQPLRNESRTRTQDLTTPNQEEELDEQGRNGLQQGNDERTDRPT